MSAIDLLKEQHEEVRQLFQELEENDDDDQKATTFHELADQLAAHATIEEELFYPAAYAGETEELLEKAVEEHLAMKRLLADLLKLEPDEPSFEAKVQVLCEQVDHHVEEEERHLFPKVQKRLSKEELDELGARMEDMFEDLMEEEPSARVPSQTRKAASLKRAVARRKPGRA